MGTHSATRAGSSGGGIVHGVATEYSQKRFPTLNGKDLSNKYWTMDRVSKDGNEIVVHVADEHVVPTKYGAALILDADNVVFIKNWQYDKNYYGTEVRLNKQYWKVSKWGDHSDLFGTGDGKNHEFSDWVKVAKAQTKADNFVHWKKTPAEQMVQSFKKTAENKKNKAK